MKFLSVNLVLLAGFCCSFVQSKPVLDGILDKRQYASSNDRPIIGVLAQESEDILLKFGKTFIPACYIKYLESAGARVVPIRNDLSEAELKYLFSSLNGFIQYVFACADIIYKYDAFQAWVLFPGGDADLWTSGYARTATTFFDLAVKAKDAGDIFPLWGTCLGFQMLHVLAAKGKDILTWCHGRNVTLPLNFTKDYKNSKMFGPAPEDITNDLGKLPITQNMHRNCVSTETYEKEPMLNNFYKVLSTNEDKNGKVRFASTVEAIDYPFFATQWHPEKNQFEWTTYENINHSQEAIISAQYMANFFVNQARQSKHKFPCKNDEDTALIYNYNPVPCMPDVTHYEQCYFF